MWHGAAQSDARWSVEKFRTLSKDDRDAVGRIHRIHLTLPGYVRSAGCPGASPFGRVRTMHSHTNERMKLLKRLAFGLLGAVMAVLVTATVLEKIYGTDFAAAHIYGAGWFAALWGVLTLAALACLFRRKLWRRPAVLLLHLSFAVILAGASVTWLFGRQGTLHLRTGDPGGERIRRS